MARWLFMVSVPMFFTYVSYNRSCTLSEQGFPKDRLYWFLTVSFLVMFAGLRMRYNDTVTYLNTFANPELTPTLSVFFKNTSFSLNNYWAYLLLKSALKTIGMDNHLILLSFTIFYTTVHFWFIRKYASNYLPMAMFIFIADGYMLLLAALKQVCAIACALLAIDAILNKKYFKYAVWMFIAFLFHPYVLVLGIVPFLVGVKPWSTRTWIIVIVKLAMGFQMQSTAGIIAQYNDVYDVNSLLDHTMNPIRFAVSLVPIGISFLFRNVLFDDSTKEEDLFANLTICRTLFYFWALFGNPIVFARVANYFDFSNAIFLAWAINKVRNDENTAWLGDIMRVGLYFGFLIFSYYSGVKGYDFVRQTEHISFSQLMTSIHNWIRL